MKRPHILMITTDQQRGDCLGIAGHPAVKTPNLDWLAASGCNFPHAYAEVPSCVPARRSMISGMKPEHHGMVGYVDGQEWELEHSLPGELSKVGYQTELVGKLHLWPQRKRYGFDHMTWSDGPNMPDCDYQRWLRENGVTDMNPALAHGVDPNGWVGRPSHLPERLEHTYWCAEMALRFLATRDPSAPFFLWVSFFAPHPPLCPPQHTFDRYMAMDLPEPVVGDWVEPRNGPTVGAKPSASRIRLDPETMKRCRAAYYGCISFIDDQVGRILRSLSKAGVANDTLVLMTSDHGEMLGDHGLFRKTFPYEASARVPFFVRAPGWMDCQQERTLGNVVGLMDIMPTLLEAAGAPVPDSVDGSSLLPAMRGEDTAWREFLHGEHTGCYRPEDGNHYLTDGREKYIWFTHAGREQFFDLVADPDECHDLVSDPACQDRVARWRERLVMELSGRPEGTSDAQRLIAGRPCPHVIA